MQEFAASEALQQLSSFTLIEALLGRRSRRVFKGAHIPDGVFAYRSAAAPQPLSTTERLLVVAACGGGSGWQNLIYRAQRYAPHLSNYAGSAVGRTFPSAAGFETSSTFFTDDTGVYVLDNRDAPLELERGPSGVAALEQFVDEMAGRIRKIADGRLDLPRETPWVEAHNTWVVNHPASLLVIPVGDLAQHVLLALCYYLQNGTVFGDDINHRPIPGLELYGDMADVANPLPLSFLEQWSMAELSAELSTSCYGGALMLQAMGLGGWMFDGVDPYAVLGAHAQEGIRGLG